MNATAAPTHGRPASPWRWALLAVPLVLLLGTAAGRLAGSGSENPWFDALAKPALQPPDWLFGVVWPILYVPLGLALAVVLAARGSRWRTTGIALFAAQLAANLVWSPLFFVAHQVSLAFWWILLILALAIATTIVFGRVRTVAAWLMLPYLVWLSFAALLNLELDRLNPDAETLAPAQRTAQI